MKKKTHLSGTGGGPPAPGFTPAEELALVLNKGRPVMEGIQGGTATDCVPPTETALLIHGTFSSTAYQTQSFIYTGICGLSDLVFYFQCPATQLHSCHQTKIQWVLFVKSTKLGTSCQYKLYSIWQGEGTSAVWEGASSDNDEETVSLDSRRPEVSCQLYGNAYYSLIQKGNLYKARRHHMRIQHKPHNN